jgi:uncharacterized RDD family membrane protein YckC
MSDLVTGEAVPLEVRLAKFPSRALAIAIDIAVLMVVGIVLFAAAAALAPGLDPALAATLSVITVIALLVGVPVLAETLTRGRSLGKLALGLRVVRDDGGPVRFRHALARGLAGFFIDFYVTFGVGAVVCSLLNERGKRVGDWLAGTVVVRERAPKTGSPVPPMPPQLAAWASTLELSRLPDELAMAARGYLVRGRDLSPRVRDEMGARLATEVAHVVTPPAPPGTPAWAYLAAVIGERSRRDSARLAAQTPQAPAAPPAPYAHAQPRPTYPQPPFPQPVPPHAQPAQAAEPGSPATPSATTDSEPAAPTTNAGGFTPPA